MIPELEQAPETSFFDHVIGVDDELQALIEAPEYARGINELDTRHDVPAYVEDEVVTKVVPQSSSPEVVDENIEALIWADIDFPSGVIWEETVNGETYDVVQHGKAFGSQDSGFWSEFNSYIEEFRSIGVDAADQGVYLDFQPQNFGIINEQLVYLDTADNASLHDELDTDFVKERMARQLQHGMKEASYPVDKHALRDITEYFDPDLRDTYSRV